MKKRSSTYLGACRGAFCWWQPPYGTGLLKRLYKSEHLSLRSLSSTRPTTPSNSKPRRDLNTILAELLQDAERVKGVTKNAASTAADIEENKREHRTQRNPDRSNERDDTKPTTGFVYRQFKEPPSRKRPIAVTAPDPPLGYTELESGLVQKVIQPPTVVDIPKLLHGLEECLHNPGVHKLIDPITKGYRFNPFLQRIHQPGEVNYNAMQPFTTTSRDTTLHGMAIDNSCKYKGSTSSISPIFAHLYYSISNYKSPDTSCLGPSFLEKPSAFTRTSMKPACVMLRPTDGIYSVDSDNPLNRVTYNVLMDLGRSLEAMFTTEEETFKQHYLKGENNNTGGPTLHRPHAYHYLRVGDMLLRAQLDCHDPNLPEEKTFDVKTRATARIRWNIENYANFTDFRLDRLRGEYSYESEYYDMIRSAFLKYSLQIRIGRMAGVFVAYHNTEQIFGFEYITKKEIERVIYGSTEFADRSFEIVSQLWSVIAGQLTSKYPGQTLQLVLQAVKNSDVVDVFVRPVKDDKGWKERVNIVLPPNSIAQKEKTKGDIPSSPLSSIIEKKDIHASPLEGEGDRECSIEQHRQHVEESAQGLVDIQPTAVEGEEDVEWWKLKIRKYLNGRLLLGDYTYTDGDALDIFYEFAPNVRSQREKVMCYRRIVASVQ